MVLHKHEGTQRGNATRERNEGTQRSRERNDPGNASARLAVRVSRDPEMRHVLVVSGMGIRDTLLDLAQAITSEYLVDLPYTRWYKKLYQSEKLKSQLKTVTINIFHRYRH